jgi:hypothetical protein
MQATGCIFSSLVKCKVQRRKSGVKAVIEVVTSMLLRIQVIRNVTGCCVSG